MAPGPGEHGSPFRQETLTRPTTVAQENPFKKWRVAYADDADRTIANGPTRATNPVIRRLTEPGIPVAYTDQTPREIGRGILNATALPIPRYGERVPGVAGVGQSQTEVVIRPQQENADPYDRNQPEVVIRQNQQDRDYRPATAYDAALNATRIKLINGEHVSEKEYQAYTEGMRNRNIANNLALAELNGATPAQREQLLQLRMDALNLSPEEQLTIRSDNLAERVSAKGDFDLDDLKELGKIKEERIGTVLDAIERRATIDIWKTIDGSDTFKAADLSPEARHTLNLIREFTQKGASKEQYEAETKAIEKKIDEHTGKTKVAIENARAKGVADEKVNKIWGLAAETLNEFHNLLEQHAANFADTHRRRKIIFSTVNRRLNMQGALRTLYEIAYNKVAGYFERNFARQRAKRLEQERQMWRMRVTGVSSPAAFAATQPRTEAAAA